MPKLKLKFYNNSDKVTKDVLNHLAKSSAEEDEISLYSDLKSSVSKRKNTLKENNV